jgi:hypothetical protein
VYVEHGRYMVSTRHAALNQPSRNPIIHHHCRRDSRDRQDRQQPQYGLNERGGVRMVRAEARCGLCERMFAIDNLPGIGRCNQPVRILCVACTAVVVY